jgi:APA family basic amino acid/polyamine antiporter
MVCIKVAAICVFVAVAVFHIQPDLWHPFMPFGWYGHAADGKPIGILAGASVVFFAYVGFDAVSTAVEETANPQRDVPRGILGSLAFCTVIYIIVSGLLTGVVSYTELKVDMPVAYALEKIGVSWASALVITGVITGLTTVMLVLYYGLTRIILGMARDGLLPPVFGQVSDTRHTPVKTTVLCGIIMAVMAGCIPLGMLAELVNIGTLVAFVLVCAGVIVLRIKQPDLPRPFKAPGGLVMPVLGILSCGALVIFLPWQTHVRFVLWLVAGMVIYFAYSIRHSKATG